MRRSPVRTANTVPTARTITGLRMHDEGRFASLATSNSASPCRGGCGARHPSVERDAAVRVEGHSDPSVSLTLSTRQGSSEEVFVVFAGDGIEIDPDD